MMAATMAARVLALAHAVAVCAATAPPPAPCPPACEWDAHHKCESLVRALLRGTDQPH
jgi:hypothetical protein